MCGTTIHMLSNLKMLLHKLSAYEASSALNSVTRLNPNNKIFMYVRSTCGYSKRAYEHLKELKVKELVIVDRNSRRFMCPEKWGKILQENSTVAEDLDKLFPPGFTHPQVFTHEHPNWKHVGGFDSLLSASNVQDDMVELAIRGSTKQSKSTPILKY